MSLSFSRRSSVSHPRVCESAEPNFDKTAKDIGKALADDDDDELRSGRMEDDRLSGTTRLDSKTSELCRISRSRCGSGREEEEEEDEDERLVGRAGRGALTSFWLCRAYRKSKNKGRVKDRCTYRRVPDMVPLRTCTTCYYYFLRGAETILRVGGTKQGGLGERERRTRFGGDLACDAAAPGWWHRGEKERAEVLRRRN